MSVTETTVEKVKEQDEDGFMRFLDLSFETNVIEPSVRACGANTKPLKSYCGKVNMGKSVF